jgi:hypothetical protein
MTRSFGKNIAKLCQKIAQNGALPNKNIADRNY